MKKKVIKIFFPLLLFVSCPVYAQEQTTEAGQQITASGMSGILVSFLYLAAVLALIYVILLVIDRYAKKHNQTPEQEQNKIREETDAADQAPAQNIENHGSTNEDKKSDE